MKRSIKLQKKKAVVADKSLVAANPSMDELGVSSSVEVLQGKAKAAIDKYLAAPTTVCKGLIVIAIEALLNVSTDNLHNSWCIEELMSIKAHFKDESKVYYHIRELSKRFNPNHDLLEKARFHVYYGKRQRAIPYYMEYVEMNPAHKAVVGEFQRCVTKYIVDCLHSAHRSKYRREIREVTLNYLRLNYPPSFEHSSILALINKTRSEYTCQDFLTIVNRWGFDKLREDDYRTHSDAGKGSRISLAASILKDALERADHINDFSMIQKIRTAIASRPEDVEKKFKKLGEYADRVINRLKSAA